MIKEVISMEQAWNHLISYFPVKVIIGFFIAVVLDVRTIIFMSFMWLIFLDCFTRWLAISYEYLKEQGMEEPSLLDSLKGIPEARRAGRISSHVMRKQGVEKLLLYNICALGAALCDLISFEMHSPMGITALVISYLAVSELLSIIENLSEAGVQNLGRLVTKLKGRL